MKRLLLPLLMLWIATPAASGQNEPVATTAPGINLRRTVTVDVVRRTKDAVVYISTTKLVHTSPFGGDLFWQVPFPGRDVAVTSLGSGFIVHEDGYIVTNNHVIDRARQINVDLPDGRKLPAELVSTDAEADLAILKIKSDKPLPTLELGDSADLMIGEPVIAVGNPLGYSHSVSTGIVSAIHRDLQDPNVKLQDLIQTDAAINPGNSGGPLLNAYGQVIGINTAIRGDAQNIGFAIQINRLRDLVPTLMNPAAVSKVDVPVKLKEERTVTPPATVKAVVRVTDANDKSGVVAINGHPPRDIVDAYVQLLKIKAGAAVKIDFAGGEQPRTVTASAVAAPDAIVQAKKKLGIGVEPLTPMLAEKYGLDIESGMMVTEVQNGSLAAKSGVEAGDIILGLGPYRITSLEDFAQLLAALPKTGRVQMHVRRGEQQGYLWLKL